MEEPQDTLSKSFRLYPKHITYLENVNENTSLALRMVLDENIRNEKRNNIKTSIDKSMIWICFGLMFFIMSFLCLALRSFVVDDMFLIVSSWSALGIGVFVLMYGLIGGVTTALSRTRVR